MPPSAAATKKLMREINQMTTSPPEGIRLQVNEDDMLDVTGIIEGPEETPYAGGYFKVRFVFTEEFPAAPPKCWFSTKLFHPNVGPAGEICVNTLKKDWKATYGIQHILVTVKCLLIYPNPESALDEEAGKMFMEDYKSYCSRAKLITSVHATPRTKPVEFETPSVTDAEPSAKPSTETAPVPSAPSSSKAVSTSSPPASTMSSPRLPTSRKAGSPGPQQSLGLKSTLTVEKASKQDRHPSPSPLGTADANVAAGKQAGVGLGMGMAAGSAGVSNTGGSKAVKRSATGRDRKSVV